MYSVTDVAFRHFGHIVRMDGNSFQSITIFHSIMFYSILELENTIAPVYLLTSTEILDPGLTYYRRGSAGSTA